MFEELKSKIDAARKDYQDSRDDSEDAWRPLSDKVKYLQAELQRAICEGAYPCRACGSPPIGLEQPRDVGPRGAPCIITMVEIGCAGRCPSRVLDPEREKAVATWNSQYGAGG